MRCGKNKFCVGFEGNRVYCYGKSDGCLWDSNDCSTDQDCKKYSTQSAKYTVVVVNLRVLLDQVDGEVMRANKVMIKIIC